MKSYALLLVLLLLLLPQLVGWIVLSRATPFLAWVVSTTWHKDQPIALRESGLWYQDGRGAWKEAIRYDLQAMHWELVPESNMMRAFELADPPPKAQYWSIDWKSKILKPDEPCMAELIDRATNKVLKTRQLPYPCHLVDYRYAVSIDWNWLDLDDPDSAFQKFTEPGAVGAIWRFSHNQTVVIQHDKTLRSGGPALARASIVEFRAGEGPRVVSTWNLRNCGRDLYAVDLGDDVVSVDPEGEQIEVRSKQDGAVTYSEPLPAGVDWKTVDWEQFLNMNTPKGPLSYDYKQRTWIEVPPGGKLEMRLEGSGLQLFQVNGKHKIYNATTKRILFETPREDSVRFLDDQTILHIDEQSWVRFHFRSAYDGRILETYAPFGYVNPCLVILLVLFALWSMHWMRTSLRARLWAWIDNLRNALVLKGAVSFGSTVALTRVRIYAAFFRISNPVSWRFASASLAFMPAT